MVGGGGGGGAGVSECFYHIQYTLYILYIIFCCVLFFFSSVCVCVRVCVCGGGGGGGARVNDFFTKYPNLKIFGGGGWGEGVGRLK